MDLASSDDVLLQRFARERDEDAFAEIVRRYAGFVFSTCNRVLRDRALAEDASQETFLRLMRKPDAIQRSLAGWLHKAATQLSIDALRSHASRRARESAYATDSEMLHAASTWQEVSPHVDEVLAELPEEMRLLLVRHFLQGVSQRDLAEEGQTSTSTISRRMQQALDQLRDKLRRKGVIVAALVLTEWLALETAEAAPPTLMRELGKMAMVSGGRPTHGLAPAAGRLGGLPAPVEHGLWLKMAWTALLGASIVAVALGMGWLRLNQSSGPLHFIWQSDPPASREATPTTQR